MPIVARTVNTKQIYRSTKSGSSDISLINQDSLISRLKREIDTSETKRKFLLRVIGLVQSYSREKKEIPDNLKNVIIRILVSGTNSAY